MVTIIDVLQSHNIPFKLHGEHHHSGRGWVSVDCPKCSPRSGRFRLGFEVATGRANCWACGSTDSVVALSTICYLTLREAADILHRHIRQVRQEPASLGRLILPQANVLLSPHKKYLLSRGFDPDEISTLWMVKGIGLHPRLGWRLLIPMCDRYGQVVSWTTRSIGCNNPRRYISASQSEESVSHKDILYGAHLARHSIVIVEGPLDVWAIGPGAVATCGIAFTQRQLSEMIKYPIRVICFDAEASAQKRAGELCRHLSAFSGIVENVVLETGKDPADADRDEIVGLRRKFLFDLSS